MKNFNLLYNNEFDSKITFRQLAEKCCRTVLREEKYPYRTEVSLTIVSDEEISELNKQYRNTDKTTDVLSFPLGEPDYESRAVVLGDIVISAPTAIRQASEYGHTVEREMAFLTIHGMLHLLGYDHVLKDKSDEKIMFAKQEKILQKLGIMRCKL